MTPADNFTPETYAYLRNLAARMHGEHQGGGGDSIQPTALVHEAWEKLAKTDGQRFESRKHFLAVAARAMRFILVDRARSRGRLKSADPRLQTSITGIAGDPAAAVDILDLEQALQALAGLDPLAAETVTLRIFGGLTIDEVAEALDTSPRNISKRWRFARAWLQRRLA